MVRIVLLLAALVAVSHGRRSDWECSTAGNVETCEFWLDPKGFSVTATSAPTPQQQANWCWLASIEMAFKFYGYAVPQQKLLDLLWGKIEDMPGRPEQIISATNRVYTDEAGKRFRSESAQPQSWFEASVALSQDVPVLVGYSQPGGTGHMTMIVGIQMQALYNNLGQMIDSRVSDVVLWDPWPGQGLRNMTQAEFDGTTLLVAVKTTPLEPVALRRFPTPKALKSLTYFNILGRSLR